MATVFSKKHNTVHYIILWRHITLHRHTFAAYLTTTCHQSTALLQVPTFPLLFARYLTFFYLLCIMAVIKYQKVSNEPQNIPSSI